MHLLHSKRFGKVKEMLGDGWTVVSVSSPYHGVYRVHAFMAGREYRIRMSPDLDTIYDVEELTPFKVRNARHDNPGPMINALMEKYPDKRSFR